MVFVRRTESKLPAPSIEIHDGRVVRIADWAYGGDGTPKRIFCVERLPDNMFTCTATLNRPEDKVTKSADIHVALEHLFEAERKTYAAAFELNDATAASLQKIGFTHYEVKHLD